MVLLVASALIVVFTGGLAVRLGHVLGIGSTAVTVWDIAKWPVLLVLVSLMLALLYWASPNAKQGFRLGQPGRPRGRRRLASRLWPLHRLCRELRALNKIYGSLATVIIFFVWLWITNIAVLLGAEFNAELERGRAMAAGAPADSEPFSSCAIRKLPKGARGVVGLSVCRPGGLACPPPRVARRVASRDGLAWSARAPAIRRSAARAAIAMIVSAGLALPWVGRTLPSVM